MKNKKSFTPPGSHVFEKFRDDKGLERINALYSAFYLLMNVAFAFESDVENVMERYGINIPEINHAISGLGKEYRNACYAMDQLSGKDGNRIFMRAYDIAVKDMYEYVGISRTWKPGEDTKQKNIGVQNLISHATKTRGRKVTRYIGRNSKGQLYITAQYDGGGKKYFLPPEWFKSVKRGQLTKVEIDPLMKFG